ncbi:MBOAT family O-acyltransferase [Flectobacillus longus]|uniref:MBOAT family O-acyltransferase n=1 Tax=Flectobacillus longus TaxID=2984207 RepID=UPI0024B7616D|nr:MBOAT family O-acyltransferase [Flectobacillus longus]MDI9879630.1 MBOAT family O-acyltransferase [Flectobacillus longus]
MPFNSIHFIYFFGVICPIYWLFKANYKVQNLILLVGSLYFYSQVDLKLCVLWGVIFMITSSLGKSIETFQLRKVTLTLGLLLIFSQLFIAKYYNWLIGDFSHTISIYKFVSTIGLSYYTLAACSYLIDIYRKKLSPVTNPITLGAYLSFFPQLLSGPIPIAYKDLPQYSQPRNITINSVEDAGQRILWGIFKKVIVSGLLAKPVDYIFYNHSELGIIYLWLAIILYSFQVYMDFSGYSDMAWGIAKLLGIKINANFNSPFISRTIDEFWRRWHLSLSAWLKEYIYLPLGGRGNSKWQYMVNIFIVFFMSGVWHGANANFILWGSFNGLLFLFAILTGWTREKNDVQYGIKGFTSMFLVFLSIAFTRVFFRSPDFATAITYYKEMFRLGDYSIPDIGLEGLGLSLLIVLIEWLQRNRSHPADISAWSLPFRIASYASSIIIIYWAWPTQNPTEYIYFKF